MTPWESKKARTINLVLVVWTFAFTGPGTPFSSHCLGYCLVSDVCMDTADSSMVIIWSRTDFPSTPGQREPERSARAPPSDHRTEVLWPIWPTGPAARGEPGFFSPKEAPRPEARVRNVTLRSASTAANTEAITLAVMIHFSVLKSLRSSAICPLLLSSKWYRLSFS
jgi:hypothetical protein